ncbi:MAG: integrase core domain-containing protein, partial [Burkholderiales bacterium]|nr:integrase core domain-containing protein [Burkholderiales bacterium]
MFVDIGSEFSDRLLDLWAYHHHVRIDFSRPGKPVDNCFVETFNGSLRDECLNSHWFDTLAQAREVIEAWRVECNESRPHMALGILSPHEFACQAMLLSLSQVAIGWNSPGFPDTSDDAKLATGGVRWERR